MRHRKRAYFIMMGTCVGLFVLAWGVVRFERPEEPDDNGERDPR